MGLQFVEHGTQTLYLLVALELLVDDAHCRAVSFLCLDVVFLDEGDFAQSKGGNGLVDAVARALFHGSFKLRDGLCGILLEQSHVAKSVVDLVEVLFVAELMAHAVELLFDLGEVLGRSAAHLRKHVGLCQLGIELCLVVVAAVAQSSENLVGLGIVAAFFEQLGKEVVATQFLGFRMGGSASYTKVVDGFERSLGFAKQNLGLCQRESLLERTWKVLIDGQGAQFLLVGVLLWRDDQAKFGFGIEIEALHGIDARCPDVTFGDGIFAPPEATCGVRKCSCGGIEVALVELRLARQNPGIVQERVEFAVGEPKFVFGSILAATFGLVGHTLSLHGYLAFLDGAVELGICRRLLGVGQLIDGVQLDALSKFLIVLVLHRIQPILERLVAVEVGIVFRRHRLHPTVQLGVALASAEAHDEQHRDARRDKQMKRIMLTIVAQYLFFSRPFEPFEPLKPSNFSNLSNLS